MFGSAAPATGFGAPASTSGNAPGSFGTTSFTGTNTTAPAGGGFGAPAAAAPATSTSGFGVKPAPAGGFGTTTGTGGFGAAAGAGGVGAPAATGGFGAKFATAGGFGTAPATGGGFGVGAAGGGFGSAPAAGGWGMPQAQAPAPAAPPAQPTVTLQDFTRQSALASYLVKLDQSYNALHPNCHFTAFVYNSCGAGQVMDAIQKERYTAYLNGGGCSDEAYMAALHKNPDPGRLYPSPIHFSQELLKRTEKQREAVQVLQAKVAEVLQDVDAVAAMDAANVRRQREVEQEEMMLRHRWYTLLCKMELLRRQGTSYGEESLLNGRVEQLRQLLRAPGRYGQLLGELRPFVTEEASRVAMVTQQSAHKSEARHLQKQQQQRRSTTTTGTAAPAAWCNADGQPLLRSEVDPHIMRDWIQFAKQMQDGIETLDELLKTDLKEMQAIRSRVEAA